MAYKHGSQKSIGLLILRVFVGVIFIIHGVQAFDNKVAMIQFFGQLGLSPFWMYLTATVEIIAGIALVLGVFTRIASALLVIIGICAIYFFKWKIGAGSWLSEFAAAEIDLALIGANLALFFTGAGRLSLTRFCKCQKTGKRTMMCAIVGCEHDCDCKGGTCDAEAKPDGASVPGGQM